MRNLLLAQLPESERTRLLAEAETLPVRVGDRLMEEEAPQEHMWFPLSAIISNLRVFTNGSAVEVGLVGREGLAGFHPLLGVECQPNASVVQTNGDAVRIRTSVVLHAFRERARVREIILRYVHYFLMQVSQVGACNRYHSAEERLARWLLTMHDRTDGDSLDVTQEFLAYMLATRRASINAAVGELRRCRAISTKRNTIIIDDRERLEQTACECYPALVREGLRTIDFKPRSA
jgi:CRP-like cAMP-binding protein